jgi:hypothetical protein
MAEAKESSGLPRRKDGTEYTLAVYATVIETEKEKICQREHRNGVLKR